MFESIATGLAPILQASVKVRHYLYEDNDRLAKKVAIGHIEKLKKQFPTKLPKPTTKRAFTTLTSDISLISREEITRYGPIDLVIVDWLYKGMLMRRHQSD